MSQEALRESLSALMDDEANELELRRILSSSPGEIDAVWERYHYTRAALKHEPLLPGLNLAARVAAALAEDEPLSVAAKSQTRTHFWSSGLGKVAVAASVTLAVLGGVRLYHDAYAPSDLVAAAPTGSEAATPIEHSYQSYPMMAQVPAVLAGYDPNSATAQIPQPMVPGAESQWLRQRYPEYLRQHTQQELAPVQADTLPYARAASLENR